MKPYLIAAILLLTVSVLCFAACGRAGDERESTSTQSEIQSFGEGLNDKAESVKETVKDEVSKAAETVKDGLSEAAETVREGVSDAAESLRDRMESTSGGETRRGADE